MRHCLYNSVPQELNVSGVYMLQIASHIYIGSSKNIRTRVICHRKMLREHKHTKRIQEQYDKYGEQELYASVLEECSSDVMLEKEEFWIKSLCPDLNRDKTPTNKPIYKPWNHPNISKRVYRYDFDGNYIDSFPSVREAQRSLNVKSSVLIAAAANPSNITFKSAYGYLWSYDKKDKLKKYENHSKDAKKVSVIMTEIISGKELTFNSIAKAIRTLFPNTDNFDSLCATASDCAKGKVKTIKGLYTAKYK